MYKILANTIFLGKDVHFLPECHSTNDMAMELVKNGKAIEGTIVVTDHQTRGKGQRGNSWESGQGQNITFSLVLQPKFLDVTEQFLLNIAVSCAIVKVLKEYVLDIKVKWPNDIVAPGMGKIGGVLIENSIGSRGWEVAIVGIGLNINQSDFAVSTAQSLKTLTGTEFNREELLKLLVAQLEQEYIQLKRGNVTSLWKDYLSNLFLKDEWAQYSVGEQLVEGKIIGVSATGQLQLEDRFGVVNSFGLKEIKFLNK